MFFLILIQLLGHFYEDFGVELGRWSLMVQALSISTALLCWGQVGWVQGSMNYLCTLSSVMWSVFSHGPWCVAFATFVLWGFSSFSLPVCGFWYAEVIFFFIFIFFLLVAFMTWLASLSILLAACFHLIPYLLSLDICLANLDTVG